MHKRPAPSAVPDVWNPEQYQKFQAERSRPFWDLAQKVNFKNVTSMLDVGCGTGELTRELHLRQKLKSTLGIDSSANMLATSATSNAAGLSFAQVAAENFSPKQKLDLVFSNAALQWIDDHPSLFTQMLRWLRPGGTLAVQMPVNFTHPSHQIAQELIADFGVEPRRIPVLTPEEYGQLFYKFGMREIDISIGVYAHPMSSAREVVEWTKGTFLTHYQKQLTPESFAEFLERYTRALLKVAGEGHYLYFFRRLFLVASGQN